MRRSGHSSISLPPMRPTRSRRSTRYATIRMRPSSGSIGPGATAMGAYSFSCMTPSSCASGTIRALRSSVARSVCQRRRRLGGGHERQHGVPLVAAMTTQSRAVFLSYASEDAPAAQRIADGLRAAGIEVWFDREELRGGDAWDQKIRREIHECALFIPVVSANTTSRREGYFRFEWDLADQR